MSQTFDIQSKFKPAGDQPKAIEQLIDGLEDGLNGFGLGVGSRR